MASRNVELVQIGYDVAYLRRSIDGFEDHFTDDFAWHQRPEWPGRPVYGRDELTSLWEDLDATYVEYSVVPREMLEVSNCVVVTVNASARMRASDHRIEVTMWHVWRFRDGRLAETRVYSNQNEAVAAACT